MTTLNQTLADLVSAYHVLHNEKILQEYGSVSVRNPENPATFFTSGFPAILVSSRDHLLEFAVSDASRVSRPLVLATQSDIVARFIEPYLHSCIYDRYPGVQSVVHSHASCGIIYGLCDAGGSMLMPVYNKAGFVGTYNPIFNPADYYHELPESHLHDLRVSHKTLGERMASLLRDSSANGTNQNQARGLPDYSCVLLRGNGVAVWHSSIQGAVHKAIHMQRNTEVQTAAMLQRAHSSLELTYLDEREAADSETSASNSLQMMWSAWVAEVERISKYQNNVRVWNEQRGHPN